MKQLNYTITGLLPLLINNPQCADPLNKYSKLKKPLTSKRSKTDDDLAELADLDIRSKIYWDDEIGIYIPSSWVLAAIAANSFSVCKVSKKSVRGGVFMNEHKLKLTYKNINKVKKPVDIIKNEIFRHKMILPQGQVRLAKVFPIFHDWSASGSISYDENVITDRDVKLIIEKACKYGGFGDFRPSFGRAEVAYD